MTKLTIDAEAASVCYKILVDEARARNDDDERDCFIRYVTRTANAEWRFMGSLGFGGKFYFDGYGPPRISCYRENETPERLATIERVNGLLHDLFSRAALADEGGR